VPAGLAGEHGEVPCGLADRQRAAATRCEDTGAVGGHPAELLIVELDEHPRGQGVDPRQQRIGALGLPVGGDHVPGGDQPGQADRQPPVPAAAEVRQRLVQPSADRARRHPCGDRREAEHRVSHPADQQIADSRAFRNDRRDGSGSPAACSAGGGRAQRCEELPSAHVVILSPGLGSNPRCGRP
jgi:hypothetical protein